MTNWTKIFDRAGYELVRGFANGTVNAHTFRNTSMEARHLLERCRSADEARRLARNACRRRDVCVA